MSDSAGTDDLLSGISANARARVRSAEAAIVELGLNWSGEALLGAAFFNLVAHPEGTERHAGSDTSTATLERLAFLLWRVTPSGQALPTAEVVRQLLDQAGDLIPGALLAAATAAHPRDTNGIVARLLIDAHVVRGSAYPEQTLGEVRGIFGPFDAWYRETLGATPSELAECLIAIAYGAEDHLNRWIDRIRADAQPAIEVTELPTGPRAKRRRRLARRKARAAAHQVAEERVAHEAATLFVARDACRLPDGTLPSDKVWSVLLQLIGLDRETGRTLDNPLVVRTRPVVIS